MNTMLTILGVVAGAILLVVFGLGAVAAVAHSFFRFLKGVFRIGFEASKEGARDGLHFFRALPFAARGLTTRENRVHCVLT